MLGIGDLEMANGYYNSWALCKNAKGKNHPKIDDEIIFKGLLKEIGGMN